MVHSNTTYLLASLTAAAAAEDPEFGTPVDGFEVFANLREIRFPNPGLFITLRARSRAA